MRKTNAIWISISISVVLLSLLSASAGAQFLPGDASSVAPAGKQADARIARGGSGYLLVWSDTRTVLAPIFLGAGGPCNGDGLGTMTDVYVARLDATGKLLDSTPLVIAEAMYNQTMPQVGWNGQNWLVVWTSERSTNRYYQDLLAARVAPDGTVMDNPPLVLRASNTPGNVPAARGRARHRSPSPSAPVRPAARARCRPRASPSPTRVPVQGSRS
jgi:hypothetical protein